MPNIYVPTQIPCVRPYSPYPRTGSNAAFFVQQLQRKQGLCRVHKINAIRTFITSDSTINSKCIYYLNEFRYEFLVDIRAYVWLKMIWQHPVRTRPLSQFRVHDHCYLVRANQIQPYMHHQLFQPLTFWHVCGYICAIENCEMLKIKRLTLLLRKKCIHTKIIMSAAIYTIQNAWMGENEYPS